MMVFLIILSCLLWIGGVALLFRRLSFAPAFGYLGLLTLSFAKDGGMPLLPISPSILWGWLAITAIVTLSAAMQPQGVKNERRGTGYMAVGALTGLAVGLLGFSVTADLSLLYGIMVVAVAVGVCLGFLLFTRTPHGAAFGGLRSGALRTYLPAKGFPIAITVMQIGIALVLAVALQKFVNL